MAAARALENDVKRKGLCAVFHAVLMILKRIIRRLSARSYSEAVFEQRILVGHAGKNDGNFFTGCASNPRSELGHLGLSAPSL
jgi:hypothetical protein